MEGELHIRYFLKLKSGEVIVVHTDNERLDSVQVQSNNENNFFCLPKMVVNKDDVSYIKVDVQKINE